MKAILLARFVGLSMLMPPNSHQHLKIDDQANYVLSSWRATKQKSGVSRRIRGGGPCRIRTDDLRLAKAALCQLSQGPECHYCAEISGKLPNRQSRWIDDAVARSSMTITASAECDSILPPRQPPEFRRGARSRERRWDSA